MGINVQKRGAKWQLRVTDKLLQKPYFSTFEDEKSARDYGMQLQTLLMRGIVPSELLAPADTTSNKTDPTFTSLIREYRNLAPVTDSDNELLSQIADSVTGVRVSGVTMRWAESYVAALKTPEVHLAPSTIRKRIGSLARVLDWHLTRDLASGESPAPNALKLLPRGYSIYTKAQADVLEGEGLEAKIDVSRDRRLAAEEEVRVRAALAGEKRPDRERALVADPMFTLMFDLILDTGMRLSEAYRLRVDQIDLARRVIHVEGSKGHRGVLKPRTVPIKRVLLDKLTPAVAGREGLLFPFWDGEKESRPRTSNKLSARFRAMFGYANVEDITEHDLRHEATCRWFTLRRPDGAGWIFSDIEVCRIMGWTDTKMALRYASLRGEDLSARLLD